MSRVSTEQLFNEVKSFAEEQSKVNLEILKALQNLNANLTAKAEAPKSEKTSSGKKSSGKTEKQTEKKEYGVAKVAIEKVNGTTVRVHVCDDEWTEEANFKRTRAICKAVNQYLKATYGAKGIKDGDFKYCMELSAKSMKELYNSKADTHFKGSTNHFEFTPEEVSALLDAKFSDKTASQQAKERKQW